MSGYFYIFASILFGVISQLIIKWKMSDFSFDSYKSVYEKFEVAILMLINPYILISSFFALLAGLTWMIAMMKFDISYAYPFTFLGLILILFLSALLFDEPVTWQKVIGLTLIGIGVFISSKSM